MITRNIKECFITRNEKENLFVCFDFSQLEICGLAELSGDTVLIEELNTGVDIHSANASVWKKQPFDSIPNKDKVRKQAKVMTFQLQYGAGAPKMAETLNIPMIEAVNFINSYYAKYKGVFTYHENLRLLKIAEGNPKDINDYLKVNVNYSKHPMGREYVIKAKNYEGKLYFPLTELKNYPVQGFSTGDLVPLVVNKIISVCSAYFKENIPVLVSTVHDDFTLEINSEQLYEVLAIVEEVFNNLYDYFEELFDYKLKVRYNYDVKIGSNFADMQKITRKEVQDIIKYEVSN